MAHGAGARWQENPGIPWTSPATFKQLVPLGNETIITRTIRQLREYNLFPTVIAPGDLFPSMPERTNFHSFREPTGSLIRGIWLTSKMDWSGDRTIILLGDVVYSNKSIRTILTTKIGYPFVYGRLGSNEFTGKTAPELFALHIPKFYYKILAINLFQKEGKLWDLYHREKVKLVQCFDYTDDLDSPQEFTQFFGKLSDCALKDDEKYENSFLV